jgi:hypothetical protein
MELLTLATTTNDSRVQIFDGRITFLFFFVSAGDEPIVFLNPNITNFATKLKNGVATESGTVSMDGPMRAIQLSDANPVQTVNIEGETLRVTLQRKEKIQKHDMEIDLFVEVI